ncbi:hypothetical protein [Nocardia sp. XZ_19_369]|uniref:hypothetical protein n=1 Tax=Nocardia sp. XZ_19_369 TaxID=2769487 RepID=UPI00188E0127|nr:hypothetical protein [Nocardia sp. XZ_19_369]
MPATAPPSIPPPAPWAIKGYTVWVLHGTHGKAALRGGGPEETTISHVTKTLIVLDNGDRFPIKSRVNCGEGVVIFEVRQDFPHYKQLVGADHPKAPNEMPAVIYRLWGIGENGRRVYTGGGAGVEADILESVERKNAEAVAKGLPPTWRAEFAVWKPLSTDRTGKP